VDDIVGFVKRNKRLLIAFLALILILALVTPIFSALPVILKRILPLAVLLLGLYMLFQRPKKRNGDGGQ
jgi:uncharacterized membrane protein YfcA